MKKCTNCGAEMQDSSAFCVRCGTKSEIGADTAETTNNGGYTSQQNNSVPPTGNPYQGAGNTAQSGFNNQQTTYAPPVDIFDHTAEFDPVDISNNKVIAMLVYLIGIWGIIIALLAANNSKYAAFHVRQALKFTVLEIITAIITVLFFWTFLVPIATGIFYIVLFVVKITCFFSICKGRAKEPAIVRGFNFLN